MCGEAIHAEELRNIIKDRKETDLIEILHQVQNRYGYISKEDAEQIAVSLGIPLSKVYGVCTFYSRFRLIPQGRYAISVCLGTACYVKGAEDILNKFSELLHIGLGETTEDLKYSLVEARCVGECAYAPVVTVNDRAYRNVTLADVEKILGEIEEGEDGTH